MSMQLVTSSGPGTSMASGHPMMLQNGGVSPGGSYVPGAPQGHPMMLQNGGVSPGGSVVLAGNGSFSMPSGQMVPSSHQMVAYNQPPMTTVGPTGSSMVLAPPPTGPQMGSSIAVSGGGSPMAISGMSPGFGAMMPSNASMADIAVGEEGRTTLPVRLRETEALDSKDVGTLPAGTNFTVQLVAGRRILITATSTNQTGWISTRSQDGQPLIAKFGPAVGMPVVSQQQMPPPFRPQPMTTVQQSPAFQPRPLVQVETPVLVYAAAPPVSNARITFAEIPVAVSARDGSATYGDAQAKESVRSEKGGGWFSWFQGDIAFDGAKGVAPEWTRRHGMMEYKNSASYVAPLESPQSVQLSPYSAPGMYQQPGSSVVIAPQQGMYQQPGSSVVIAPQQGMYQQPGSSVVIAPQQVQYRPGSSVLIPAQPVIYAGR